MSSLINTMTLTVSFIVDPQRARINAIAVLLVIILGINCSTLNLAHADINTTSVVYETNVNVSCNVGYEFSSNQNWIVTQCQAAESWSPQLTDCSGTIITVIVTSRGPIGAAQLSL